MDSTLEDKGKTTTCDAADSESLTQVRLDGSPVRELPGATAGAELADIRSVPSSRAKGSVRLRYRPRSSDFEVSESETSE